MDALALSMRLLRLRFYRHVYHGEKTILLRGCRICRGCLRFGMSRVIKDRPTSILPPACRSVKTLSEAPPDGLKIRTAEAGGQYVRRFTGWRSDAYDLPPGPPFPRKFSKARAISLVIGGPSAGVISVPGVAHPRRPCVPCSRSRLRLSKGMSVLM